MPSHLENASAELGHPAIQRQQLEDRQAMLLMLQEFRHSSPLSMMGSAAEKIAAELEKIRKQLEELEVKEQQLQKKGNKEEAIQNIIDMGGVSVFPFLVDLEVAPPPPFPAPQVIQNADDLPPHPANTLCPSCQQYITTETVTRVGSVAWLVCVMAVMCGCVAGCCLLPFCMDNFKDTVHKCPRCRSRIHICKKL